MGRLDDVTVLLFAHNSINTDEINDISDFSPKLWQSIHGVLQMAVNTPTLSYPLLQIDDTLNQQFKMFHSESNF